MFRILFLFVANCIGSIYKYKKPQVQKYMPVKKDD